MTFSQKDKICKCGHTHISEVGTNSEGNEELHFERIEGCEYCDCEKFRNSNCPHAPNRKDGGENQAKFNSTLYQHADTLSKIKADLKNGCRKLVMSARLSKYDEVYCGDDISDWNEDKEPIYCKGCKRELKGIQTAEKLLLGVSKPELVECAKWNYNKGIEMGRREVSLEFADWLETSMADVMNLNGTTYRIIHNKIKELRGNA